MKNNISKATERKNHRKAWAYFEAHGYKNHRKMVLHHADTSMKTRDPERYACWNPEDLIPMSMQDHRRLHMAIQNAKGTKFTEDHLENLRKSMTTRVGIGSKIVKITGKSGKDVKYFSTYAEAARYIGCSKALVSQCLNKKQANRTACGYEIELFEKTGQLESRLLKFIGKGKTTRQILDFIEENR